MEFDKFLEMVCSRPLPKNPIARIRTFARELAEGAVNKIWSPKLSIKIRRGVGIDEERFNIVNNNLLKYCHTRWNNNYPSFAILRSMHYIDTSFVITGKAFELLRQIISVPIFISYKRTESSAFALLIEYRLSQAGMLPFLDKQLQAGDDWHAELEDKIKNSDYFVILLGQKTLKSPVTVKEIQWALEADVAVIPIWHNEFEYKSGTWEHIPVSVDKALSNTHTIRVLEENPLTYETALQELLNRFGIATI